MSELPSSRARTARLALVVGVVAISFAAIFFRKAAPTPPLAAAAYRLTLSSLLLLPFTWRGWRRGRLSAEILQGGVVCGVLYAVHFGTWATSLQLTSVAASVTLVTTTPLLLALVARITGRDVPQRHHVWALLFSCGGVACIAASDAGRSGAVLGDALAFGGAVAMALYMLVVRRLGDALDVLAFGGITTFVGALTLLGASAVLGVSLDAPTGSSLIYIVLLALVPQLIGHTALTWSLRRVRPTVVGIATVGEPVGAALLAFVWLGESISLVTAAGCTLVLAGVFVALRAER